MFPAPVDLGIAEPDRAVSSVARGTAAWPTGRGGEGSSWYPGGGSASDRAVQGITIYPPTRGVKTQGDPFEPVKIGILIDMDLGQLLADWIDPTILAIEDAPTEGIMCAQWLAAQGLRKVGMFWEQGSSGRDYADYFRDAALGQSLSITREVKLEPNPRGLVDDLAT